MLLILLNFIGDESTNRTAATPLSSHKNQAIPPKPDDLPLVGAKRLIGIGSKNFSTTRNVISPLIRPAETKIPLHRLA